MQVVALLPGLLVAVLAATRGARVAFLAGYLPVLFLFPDYYRLVLAGLPDPSFHHFAGLSVLGIGLARGEIRFRPTLGDALVLAFVVVVAMSEFLAAGYSEAQNLTFDLVAAVPVPYLLARGLVEPLGLRVDFAKRVVLLLAAVALVSLYEFKMGASPWPLVLDPFFPGQAQWVTTFRWGLARVAGPFGHAILAGAIFAVAYRVQRWLEWTGAWRGEERERAMPVGRLLTFALAAGTFMSLTRGPWLAAFAGGAVLAIARSRHRRAASWALVAAVLVIGIPALSAFVDYASVGRAAAKTLAQESAAYRYEMIDHYVHEIAEGIWLGFGRNTWPQDPRWPSIDNHYLFLALTHGLLAVTFFLAIQVRLTAMLLRYAASRDRRDPEALLAFSFVAIFVVYLGVAASVFVGAQALPLLFLVAGWAEGFLAAPLQAEAPERTPEVAFTKSALRVAGVAAGIRRVAL